MSKRPTISHHRVPWQTYLALVVGLVCLSTSGIFVRWAGVPGPVAAVYRTLTAITVLLIPFGLRAGRLAPRLGP